MVIGKTHAIALLVACLCVVGSPGLCQDIVPPLFCQINIPEVDEPANAAMDHLTTGISDVILALNRGRNQRVPIDKELGDHAMGEFKTASSNLDTVLDRIRERKINVEIIRKSPYARAYETFVVSLRQAGYQEPTTGKEFFALIKDINNHCITDIVVLMSNPRGPGDQQKVVQAFLDLIARKALLEHLGSTSGIITIAMG
jgi:hypothetical protein